MVTMGLINVRTPQLKSFLNEESRPPYAILSHTWLSESDEITFEELLRYHDAVALAQSSLADSIASRPGFKKIEGCCKVAA